MAIRSRLSAMLLGFAVTVTSYAALPLVAQEPPKSDTPPSVPSAKSTYDPSRRVPDYFGQIGLTPVQREEIYKVRAKHQQQIEELAKQVAKVRAEMVTECETVLTPTQKQLLSDLRKASVEARAARKKEQAKPKGVTDATQPTQKS